MSPVATEKTRIGDVVKWEVDPRFTREVVTLAASQGALEAGTVLGIVGGEYVVFDDTAATGAENFEGILLLDKNGDPGAQDNAQTQQVTVLRDGPAIVSKGALIWPGTADAAEIAAALAQAAARGIKALPTW